MKISDLLRGADSGCHAARSRGESRIMSLPTLPSLPMSQHGADDLRHQWRCHLACDGHWSEAYIEGQGLVMFIEGRGGDGSFRPKAVIQLQ
jgi:hypothetical protein